jgi:hypothetical protein
MNENARCCARWLAVLGSGLSLLVPGAGTAQPNLEGTWSGIFTTRHHEFWRIEDWLCFNGCTTEGVAHFKALLADPKNDKVPVEALLGATWGFMRESMKPNLVGKGIEIFETIDDSTDPTLKCEPYGFAREVVNALPIKIRRDGENLVIDYEEWTQTRTIYLDGRGHPKNPQPTPMGHSIGRYEGDALIVETVGLTPDIFYPQYGGGGYSENARGHERYTVAENPRRLMLELSVEDSTMLNKPFVASKVWLYTPDLELVHDSCADYPTKP